MPRDPAVTWYNARLMPSISFEETRGAASEEGRPVTSECGCGSDYFFFDFAFVEEADFRLGGVLRLSRSLSVITLRLK